MTQKAWVKFLFNNSRKRKITHCICTLDTRPAGTTPAIATPGIVTPGIVTTGIVNELRALPDRAAAQSAALLLDELDAPQAAQQALAAAFDNPTVTALTVYRIGDGAALSGLLIAARLTNGATLTLIFLLD